MTRKLQPASQSRTFGRIRPSPPAEDFVFPRPARRLKLPFMGIYSRDYLRETRPGDPFGAARAEWAVKYLLIANVAVFLLQNIPAVDPTDWMQLSHEEVARHGQVWRLVTYGFCHDPRSLQHIVFNMLVLWMFGRNVEPIYGPREFLAFYLSGVTVAGVCHVALDALEGDPHPAPVVGASGGVQAVVFLTAMHFPRQKVYFMFVLPIELRWLAVMYAAADAVGLFNPHAQVAHAAHLGGAAFGIAYRYFHWRLLGWWPRLREQVRGWMLRRSRPKVKLYQPSREDLDRQVDEILSKIYEHGEASLTDQEREILKTASQRYKHRL